MSVVFPPIPPAQGPLYSSRVRVYPATVHGPMRQIKWAILIACLAIYYLLPWLRWNRGPGVPDQAVLLDLAHRRFYLFWIELWPQDAFLLAGLLIIAAISLFLVTSLFGRVWCGYACPQTVWTDLFMWVERRLEGDRNARIRCDAQPLTIDKAWRKIAKHAAWLGIAFWTGGAWIMYYVDAPTVTRAFWTGAADPAVYVFTFLFTLTTYLLAGWAREQVCTYMCPWPRFQSAMLDEQSLTVTYRAWRGEPRTRGKHAPNEPGIGDCVDCAACVHACPTGIDIRDGIQLECINCGLCIDACNHVMEKTGHPPFLIAFDTLARQSEPHRADKLRWLRPRSAVYLAALLVAAGALGTAFAMRSTLSLSVLRDRAPLYVTLANGAVRNGYQLRVLNKTRDTGEYRLRIEGLPRALLQVSEAGAAPAGEVELPIASDDVAGFRLLVTVPPDLALPPAQPISFVLTTRSGVTSRYETLFMSPTVNR